MPELRWILLALGAVLIAGLWWWELKRSRAKRAPDGTEPAAEHGSPGPSGTAERQEPRFGEPVSIDEPNELPTIRAAEERPVPRGDPPVLTIDDLPEDTDRVVLAPREAPRRVETITARRDAPGDVPPESITLGASDVGRVPPAAPARAPAPPGPTVAPPGAIAAPASSGAAGAASAADSAAMPSATTPVSESRRPAPRAPAAAAPVAPAPASPPTRAEDSGAPREMPSPLQKIVALRLVASGAERIDGGALRAALEADGLRFGKYSIFHRSRADGRTLYSVASLLEPGSFDLDRMHEQLYPGVSMFAVLPGPLPAHETFDEMLASARRLAERLGALPQDERGAPLTAHRALGLREELAHFQGLVDKSRARAGG